MGRQPNHDIHYHCRCAKPIKRTVYKYCSKHKWIVNSVKTKFMVYGKLENVRIYFNGNALEQVPEYKYLGNIVKSVDRPTSDIPWWRHQMEIFSALLALCAGQSPVPGDFPAQRPVTRSFDVFFDLPPNKRLSKQSRGWWFETISCSLWPYHRYSEFIYLTVWCDPYLYMDTPYGALGLTGGNRWIKFNWCISGQYLVLKPVHQIL